MKNYNTSTLLHSCFNKDMNKIKINKNNGLAHEVVKSVMCILLRKTNSDFYTEAIFQNKSRADIIDITEEWIIEVLNTEKPINLKSKQTKYPLPIDYIVIDKELQKAVKDLVALVIKKRRGELI